MHPIKFGESFHFFCIPLLHVYVLRFNFKIESFILRFELLACYIPTPVILLPSKLWGLLIQHNIENFQQHSGVIIIIVIQFSAGDFTDIIW